MVYSVCSNGVFRSLYTRLLKTACCCDLGLIMDALKRKNVAYTKADMGNLIVILDREDYKEKLEEF